MIDLIGGPDRDRTDDLFHAMEARSQLRHRPTLWGGTLSILRRMRQFVKLIDPKSRKGRTLIFLLAARD